MVAGTVECGANLLHDIVNGWIARGVVRRVKLPAVCARPSRAATKMHRKDGTILAIRHAEARTRLCTVSLDESVGECDNPRRRLHDAFGVLIFRHLLDCERVIRQSQRKTALPSVPRKVKHIDICIGQLCPTRADNATHPHGVVIETPPQVLVVVRALQRSHHHHAVDRPRAICNVFADGRRRNDTSNAVRVVQIRQGIHGIRVLSRFLCMLHDILHNLSVDNIFSIRVEKVWNDKGTVEATRHHDRLEKPPKLVICSIGQYGKQISTRHRRRDCDWDARLHVDGAPVDTDLHGDVHGAVVKLLNS
eukprot:Opistho-2@54431